MQKISSIVLYILIAISVVLGLMFYLGPTEIIAGEDAPSFTSTFLVWTVILFGIAVLVALSSAVVSMISNPKVLVRSFISVGIIAVIFLLVYVLSAGEPMSVKDIEVTASTSKWVSTGLNFTYLLGGVAIVGMVFSEIYRAFK